MGLTQAEFSGKSGVSTTTIQRAEAGRPQTRVTVMKLFKGINALLSDEGYDPLKEEEHITEFSSQAEVEEYKEEKERERRKNRYW